MKNKTRIDRIQCRLNEKERKKFDEIKQLIKFEHQTGNRLTPFHAFSAEDDVTDSDVIRFMISHFKF